MLMFWLILIVLLVVFILIGVNGQSKENEIREKCKSKGFDLKDLISIGTYVGGHPIRNDNVDYCHVCKIDNNLAFFRKFIGENPVRTFTINIDKIKNILVEDASTIESKVTLGRVLLVGVFALAWKKKKKAELSFLIIEWNDGRFDHLTTFSFEGKSSMVSANTARNKIINLCK